MPKNETNKEKQLEGIVKKYVAVGDYKTARSYIKSWGPTINGYPVDVKLQELDKLEKKGTKKVKGDE